MGMAWKNANPSGFRGSHRLAHRHVFPIGGMDKDEQTHSSQRTAGGNTVDANQLLELVKRYQDSKSFITKLQVLHHQ